MSEEIIKVVEESKDDKVAGKPVISDNERQALIAEATKAMESQIAKPPTKEEIQSIIDTQVSEALKGRNENLIEALGGGSGKKANASHDAILSRLASDPEGFFTDYGNLVGKNVRAEVLRELEETKGKQESLKKAASAVFSERNDITGNASAIKLVQSLYGTTSDTLSEEERFKEAVKQYDSLLESQGAGNSEARLKRMAGISGGQSGGHEGKPEEKTEAEMLESWHKSRKTRAKSLRNIKIPY